MLIFLLSGWSGAGKDESGKHLVAAHGFTRVAFADALKKECAEVYDIPLNLFYDYKDQPIRSLPVDPRDAYNRIVCEFLVREFRTIEGLRPVGFQYAHGQVFRGQVRMDDATVFRDLYWTPRALLIHHGSSRRTVDPHVWVRKTLEGLCASDTDTVITDWRKENEMEGVEESAYASEHSVSVIRIRIERHAETTSQDPSERELDDFDFDETIENRGSIEQLQQAISALVTKYRQEAENDISPRELFSE